MFKSKLIQTLLAIWLLVTLFQNCKLIQVTEGGGFRSASKSSSEGIKNNGEGYTGKVYSNIAETGECTVAGSVKAEVQKVGERYYETVRDCQPVQPTDITEEILAEAYNSTALFWRSALFENLTGNQTRFSKVICRGQATDAFEGMKPFADVSMQPTDEVVPDPVLGVERRIFTGYVKLGAYGESGNLVHQDEFPVRRALEDITARATIYHIDSQTSNNVLPLTGGMGAPTSMSEFERENYSLMVFDDGTGSFVFKSENLSMPLIVPDMQCYRH